MTEAFLNPDNNVIHAEAHWVPCSTRETILVELAGKLWKYHYERTLEDVKTPGKLSYPHVQLQYNRMTNNSDKIERLGFELNVLEIRMVPYSHGSKGVTGAKQQPV